MTKRLKQVKHNIVNKTEQNQLKHLMQICAVVVPCRGKNSAVRQQVSMCLHSSALNISVQSESQRKGRCGPCGPPYNHQTFTQPWAYRDNLIIHTFESYSTESSNKNSQICFQTITDLAFMPRSEHSPAERKEGPPFPITQVASKQQTCSLSLHPRTVLLDSTTHTQLAEYLKK